MGNLFKQLFFLIISLLTVFSCHNRPSEVLPRKKMEDVMYDMYIAESIIDHNYRKFSQPENKEALINRVFQKHKISEATWDTSLSWYSDNIDQYLQINDSVKSRLQRNHKVAQQMSTQQAAMRNEFETKPPHYIASHFHIGGVGCNRGINFKLDSVQLAEKFGNQDTISFNFNVIGVVPKNLYSLKSTLIVEYADTIVYQSAKIEENKAYTLPFARQIEQDTIVALDGFIHLSGNLPVIPVQFYQISLGNEQQKDSTQLYNTQNNEQLIDKPMKITD